MGAQKQPEKLLILLSWPVKELWVNRNRGKSWHVLSNAKDAALNEGCAATLQALEGEPIPNWKLLRLAVEISAHKADKAKFDLDNLAGALKSHLDGICATLGVNDNQIDCLVVLRDVPCKAPFVAIEIRPL